MPSLPDLAAPRIARWIGRGVLIDQFRNGESRTVVGASEGVDHNLT
jgi:hypothetical protein